MLREKDHFKHSILLNFSIAVYVFIGLTAPPCFKDESVLGHHHQVTHGTSGGQSSMVMPGHLHHHPTQMGGEYMIDPQAMSPRTGKALRGQGSKKSGGAAAGRGRKQARNAQNVVMPGGAFGNVSLQFSLIFTA